MWRPTLISLIASICVCAESLADPGDTELISVIDNAPVLSTDPDLNSFGVTQSIDGSTVAFLSRATNLVPGDTNDAIDVFVYDRLLDSIERVNLNNAGEAANDGSTYAAISADARWIAFSSLADNLVPADTNDARDIFLRDRASATTRRVSISSGGVQANGNSEYTAVSDNGRYVAFSSGADNLVVGDTNGVSDIFVHDTQTGETTRISVDSQGDESNGNSTEPSISFDGRYVSFRSFATNLVAGDTNGVEDVFHHDRATGQTIRVTVGAGGVQANAVTYRSSLSGDGQHVAYQSSANNLVAGDTNGFDDVFVRDLSLNQTFRVSVIDGGGEANRSSLTPAISFDGRYVLFQSVASNLVTGDTNDLVDYFMHDRATDRTWRVSVDSTGNQASGSKFGGYPADVFYNPSISADGERAAFAYEVPGLVVDDTNEKNDVFQHDLATGQTSRIDVEPPYPRFGANLSSSSAGRNNASSADGSRVVFSSIATNLTLDRPTDRSQVYLRDRNNNTTTRVSIDAFGEPADRDSGSATLSADGNVVAFESASTNLLPSDELEFVDVYVRDLTTGINTIVSRSSTGAFGFGDSTDPVLSGSGRYVAFTSIAENLVPFDTNGATDIFVHDRQTSTTTRISVDSAGLQSNGNSSDPSISDDGRYVAFESGASNLVPGDTNGVSDIFVHDRSTGTTRRVNLGLGGSEANRFSTSPAISANGETVAYVSSADNLVARDTNAFRDVFVVDLDSGTTRRVSVDSDGTEVFGSSILPTISGDGARVAFQSDADGLVVGDTNGVADIFVHDLPSGRTTRASVASMTGFQAEAASRSASMVSDGRSVVFVSLSETLTPATPNLLHADVFLHELPASAGGSTPLEDWVSTTGGVTVDGPVLGFPGSPTGWVNSAISERLPAMGFFAPWQVEFEIQADPGNTVWTVGLGEIESGTEPADLEYGLFNRNGRLQLQRNGERFALGPILSEGDVIAIGYNGNDIDFWWQGFPIATLPAKPGLDLYVDTAFRNGVAQLSVAVDTDPAAAPDEIPIYLWRRAAGGVTVSGNALSYAGSPTGWVNSARSARFSSFGVSGRYQVSWTIGSDPSNAGWVAGLGDRETGTDWRDIDYGFASRNGSVRIVEQGEVIQSVGNIAEGDTLGLQVDGATLSYLANGQVVWTRKLVQPRDFYLDTAFRRGAMQLNDVVLTPD